jgi:hypothetical protein
MDGSTYVLLIDLPILTLVLGLGAAIAWNRNGGALVLAKGNHWDMKLMGMAAMVVLWLVVTMASLWLAFLGGLVVFYGLLFNLGQAAAWIGAVGIILFMVSIPILWAWAILKWNAGS